MNIPTSIELMREIQHRNPDVEIRNEQLEALDAIHANELAGNATSLVVMPPGLGKTVVMAADTRRRMLHSPGDRVLFLAEKNEILNQARETFIRVMGPEFSYGLFSGDGREYDELSVLFGSFQVLRRWHEAFFSDEFRYGLVDESHHSKARTYESTLNHFKFQHLLGVTATPDRLDIKDIRSIFGPEVYSLSLEEAIARGLLAAVNYYIITDNVVNSGEVLDDSGVEYSLRDFNRTVFAPLRDEEIVDIARKYAQKIRNPKTVGFCKSVAHAENFARLYDNAEVVHSRLSRKQQRDILARFRRNEIRAVFTVNMFNEGIDIPDATQILFLRETASKAVYLQQLGRGLRRTPTKKRVQVLDFVNNAERLLMVDRMWRTAASIARSTGGVTEDEDHIRIQMSNIQFDERSHKALSILRSIEGKVYRPDQDVPEGSITASHLARQLYMSTSVLMTLASKLGIQPMQFPTNRGPAIRYFLPEDVDSLVRAADTV